MNIYVHPSGVLLRTIDLPELEKRFAMLVADVTSNDYGFQTAFEAYVFANDTWHRVGKVKIGVQGAISSRGTLTLDKPARDGAYSFSIAKPFISLGQSLRYYKVLKDILSTEELESLLIQLRDVVYLEYRSPNSPTLAMRKEDLFRVSLLHETEAVSAYGGAKEILFTQDLVATRFNFTVQVDLDQKKGPFDASFDFTNRNADLPGNIFVVIGRNGLGKTRLLYAIRNALCGPSVPPISWGASQPPAFREVIAVSYSPFERFPTEPALSGDHRPAYRYCGFRNQDKQWDYESAEQSLGSNLTALIREHLRGDNAERPRLTLFITAISAGLQQSRLSISRDEKVWDITAFLSRSDLVRELEEKPVRTEDLVFDDVPFTEMSAGQKMFVMVGAAICTNVQSESLLLVDEPELYLHPNLESEYFKMLQTLLNLFESYAIIATHSIFMAREMSERNVLVLREGPSGETVIGEPRIRTFGGDLNLIADYVFDNAEGDKAYENTLNTLADQAQSYDDIATQYAGILGLESLAYLRQRMNERKRADGNV